MSCQIICQTETYFLVFEISFEILNFSNRNVFLKIKFTL